MNLVSLLWKRPQARANIRGSSAYPDLSGCAYFYQTECGVLVAVEVYGLPQTPEPCRGGIFAFHIHQGDSCGGKGGAFEGASSHYNPGDCPHPRHAGDLPPLFESHGRAFQVFLTDRFSLREVLGRTVIIHAAPDDFHTQPSGNAGERIACGRISPLRC